MKKCRRALLMFILPLALSVIMPLSVFAIVAPDSIDILSKSVYRNLLETNDRLYLFQYELAYAAYPTDYPVNQAFIFSLKNGATLLGTVLAYPYWSSAPGDAQGYGKGVVSFYFNADFVNGADDIFGNIDDPIVWGTAYTLTIDGNPVVLTWTAPPAKDFALSVNDYTLLTTTADNKLSLANKVKDISGDLETAWGADLLDTQEGQEVLSTEGEEYFVNSIPGLRAMAPSLFYVQQVAVDTTKRVWTTGYADALAAGTADDVGQTIDGSIIETGLVSGGNLLGVNKMLFGSVVVLVLTGACLVISAREPIGNLWLGWIASGLVVAGAVRLSMIHMAAIAIIGLGLIIFILWEIFGKQSG